MFNKREKQFNDLLDEAEDFASGKTEMVPSGNKLAPQLGAILAAPTPDAWVAAVKAALEVLAAKLFGNSDRPKWTKIAGAVVDIAAFVVAMIRSLKNMKK